MLDFKWGTPRHIGASLPDKALVAVLVRHQYKYKVGFIRIFRPLLGSLRVYNVFMHIISAGDTNVSLWWMGILRMVSVITQSAKRRYTKITEKVDAQREAVRCKIYSFAANQDWLLRSPIRNFGGRIML